MIKKTCTAQQSQGPYRGTALQEYH